MTTADESRAGNRDTSTHARIRARIRALYAMTDSGVQGHRFRTSVRKVVLIGCASRGGSSLLAEILRHSSQLLHLRAEINPFLALHNHTFPTSGTDSDALGKDFSSVPHQLDAVGEDLALDCGEPTSELATEADIWKFAVELTCRLTLQWAGLGIEFDPEQIHGCLNDCLRTLQSALGWRPGRFEDGPAFHALFLNRLRHFYPPVNPYHYDLDRTLIERFGPSPTPTLGPPSPILIEEPPFITIRPWKPVHEGMLEQRALVIKTPSNAYRLPYFEALFPNASIRIIHLVRNAAASINGLYDGWQYAGFFSHALPVRLRIAGYSDVFPEWGQTWWKFDLPPGWRDFTERRMEEVCAFQWLSAHEAILHHIESRSRDLYFHLRFEDILKPPAQRSETIAQLLQWLAAGMNQPLTELLAGTLPVVMATHRPGAGRWRKRVDRIEPLLREPRLRSMIDRLGYGPDPSGWE